jgi:signal transduction histidine kinase
LNRRLLIGTTPLLIIFLAVGFYAISLFHKLGGAIDQILRENYRSVVACQNMKEAAARMDSGLLFMLNGEEQRGRDLFAHDVPVFDRNLEAEAHNITLPGEGDLERQTAALYRQFAREAAAFMALPATDPARRTLYFGELQPTSDRLQATAGQILDLNQRNMLDANDRARQLSRDASRYMIITLLASFAVAALVAYALARSIVRPIQSLTDFAEQLGEGNLDQHVPVPSNDELGTLAAAFNKMAAKLRAYRQSASEKILQAQQITESALRAFPDPILVLSPGREVQLQNIAAEQFIEQVGEPLLSLGHLPALIDQALKGAADYQPTSFDRSILVRQLGAERYYLPRILAMRDDAGSILGVVIALQDVTRFRMADDVKTDLIATVSHELKTPLTSMQLAVYLLLEEKIGPLNPKQIDLLLAARNNSDRLFEMIENLLDLARFEGGAALIEKKTILPRELLSAVAERERELVTSRGLQLKIETPERLPRVAVNRARIDQVFDNLVSNAVKFSPSGGAITLSARNEDAKSVRFTVRDEGPGIPRELQRRIFDKFFRISESGEGAGLGLSIAREIVHAHGGQVGVESEQGRGSEFFFTVPATA